MIKFGQTKFEKTITNTISRKYMNNKENIETLLNRLKLQAENYISDRDYYRPINEGINTTDKKLPYKGLALTITQDETNKASHLLEVSLLHPSMATEIKRPLAIGNKKDILEFLNNAKSLDEIKQNIKEMSQKLSTI